MLHYVRPYGLLSEMAKATPLLAMKLAAGWPFVVFSYGRWSRMLGMSEGTQANGYENQPPEPGLVLFCLRGDFG